MKQPPVSEKLVWYPKFYSQEASPGEAAKITMRIAFESTVIFTPVVESLAILTNMAEICVDDIRYDAANGIVEIPMKRRETIEQNRRGFSEWLRPARRISQTWTYSVLTIRQVIAMKMDVDDILVTECNSRFSAMMGLKVENDKLYLGSLEEVRGKTLCDIHITVKGINIELVDRV